MTKITAGVEKMGLNVEQGEDTGSNHESTALMMGSLVPTPREGPIDLSNLRPPTGAGLQFVLLGTY